MNYKYYTEFWVSLFKNRGKVVTKKEESIYEIDFAMLKDSGIKLIIFDFDDTLTDFHGELSVEAKTLLMSLINNGLSVAVLSNFPRKRKEKLKKSVEGIELYLSEHTNKPNPNSYNEILNHYSLSPKEAAMVGDKIGTDLYGAYKAGIPTRILVAPFSSKFGGNKTDILSRFTRFLEKLIYT